MESILKNKQVHFEYNENGEVDKETVQMSNFEVRKEGEVKGNYNIYDGSVNINLYGLDLTFDEMKDKVEDFLLSLENESTEG